MPPTLTLQTEFIVTTTPPSSTLTQEIPHWSKMPILQEVPPWSKTPIVQQITPTICAVHFQSSDDDSNSDIKDFDTSMGSDSESEDGLVPKPDGEVERPNHGGYNLQLALNWDERLFHVMKVHEVFFSKQWLTSTLEICPKRSCEEIRSWLTYVFSKLAGYSRCHRISMSQLMS